MLNLLPFAGGDIDPDAQAWARTVVVSPARKRLVSSTIKGLKSAGVWPLIDRLWVLAAENSMQGRTCWKTRNVISLVNSPTMTVDRGLTSDGATSYGRTGFTPSSSGGNQTLNSSALFTYNNTSRAGADTVFTMGASDGTNNSFVFARSASNMMGGILNSGTAGTSASGSVSDCLGLDTAVRSANNLITAYKRGAQLGTITTVSVALPAAEIFVGGVGNSGSPLGLDTIRIAATGILGVLTAAQVSALNTILEGNILTPIGASA